MSVLKYVKNYVYKKLIDNITDENIEEIKKEIDRYNIDPKLIYERLSLNCYPLKVFKYFGFDKIHEHDLIGQEIFDAIENDDSDLFIELYNNLMNLHNSPANYLSKIHNELESLYKKLSIDNATIKRDIENITDVIICIKLLSHIILNNAIKCIKLIESKQPFDTIFENFKYYMNRDVILLGNQKIQKCLNI